MKKYLILILLFCVSYQLMAQIPVNSKAVIVATLTVTDKSVGGVGLDFGTLSPGASTGWCEVTPLNVRKATNCTALPLFPSSVAIFEVTGTKDLTYTVTVPALGTKPTLYLNGDKTSTDILHVDLFKVLTKNKATTNTLGNTVIGTLDASNKDEFYIGATLTDILYNQNPGTYTGTFNITAVYN